MAAADKQATKGAVYMDAVGKVLLACVGGLLIFTLSSLASTVNYRVDYVQAQVQEVKEEAKDKVDKAVYDADREHIKTTLDTISENVKAIKEGLDKHIDKDHGGK